MSKFTKLNRKGQHQKGFSLVELMVSMVLGTIAIAGAISMFAGSVRSNTEGLKQIRLNQEMRAIMDVMSRDIRRSGYWSNADGTSANPYQNLSVSGGDCITYTYDTSGDATPSNADKFGFRLNNNAVEIRRNGGNCGDGSSSTNWEDISDSSAIKITGLSFSLSNSYCENLSTGIVTQGSLTCSGASGGDIKATSFVIDISLEGELQSDDVVKIALNETVSVRNAWVR